MCLGIYIWRFTWFPLHKTLSKDPNPSKAQLIVFKKDGKAINQSNQRKLQNDDNVKITCATHFAIGELVVLTNPTSMLSAGFDFPVSPCCLAWPSCCNSLNGVSWVFGAKFLDCLFSGVTAAGWVESIEGLRGLLVKEKLVDLPGIEKEGLNKVGVDKEGWSSWSAVDLPLSICELVGLLPKSGHAPMHGSELGGISSWNIKVCMNIS